MNEQLQQAIATLVTKANDGIDSATSLLSAELPEYVYQLLMWHGICSAVLFIVGMVILISTTTILCKYTGKGELIEGALCYKETLTHDRYGNLDDRTMLTSSVALVICIIAVCMLNLEWLKIWIAPKVWLVDYAASLIK